MRRSLLSVIVLFFTTALCFAQNDPKAQQILALVSKKYTSFNIIRSEFSYQIENPQSKTSQTLSGVLYTHPKANKYYVSMNNQDLISDGKSQWTWLKAEKEVQLSAVDNSSTAINPAQIFTIYERGFKSLYTGDQRVGAKTAHVIELSPLDAKQSFFKVRLFVDKTTKQILSALIFDKNGNRYHFRVKTLTPNAKVAPDFFTFNIKKHPGVDLVDLR